ncbi:MAG: helix-turn-helix transcriptional regulator [Bacteroidetes bacterium]|nr:helix-turn-helix transcriptional regulator [Bacteroidota bacterium]
MHLLNSILQVATATLVLFGTLMIYRQAKYAMHLWAGIGFTLCVFCYLIIEAPFLQQPVVHGLIMTGSISVPVFFWMLSKSIFDDHFKFQPSMMGWFALQVAPHFHHYYNCGSWLSPQFTLILNITNQLISLGFVFAGMYEAFKTKQFDLIESRLRFRNAFIIVTAVLIGMTVIIEATPLVQQSKDLLQVLQRSSILLLTGYFLVSNFEFQPGFFFREIPKPKPIVSNEDLSLENELKTQLNEKKVYRKEGLTIKELADTINTQEHKLRRLINQQLGFKNFNDFLNQYRVKEACEILSDPAQNQKTILEIAYALGYQSIGPFNKAFKEQKNTTPTAYRKEQQH